MKNEYEFLGLTWPVLNHGSFLVHVTVRVRPNGDTVCSKEATLRNCLAPEWVSDSHRRFTDMWLTAGDLFEPSRYRQLSAKTLRQLSAKTLRDGPDNQAWAIQIYAICVICISAIQICAICAIDRPVSHVQINAYVQILP